MGKRDKSWEARQWDKNQQWTDQRSGCGKSSIALLAAFLAVGGYGAYELAGWVA